MDARLLRTVLTHAAALAGDRPTVPDADLLRRFVQSHDQAAFAELVRRYGRLVWAVCRHLLPNDADAEDAFQATFLALVKSAGSIRHAGKLGPWLHGVAYRVATKARVAAARRARRERAAAAAEAAPAVPDSAWDAVMAAVHDEVARLPDHLRVPFVLCGLEGKGVSEAAAELGWKLGTLSGRLTRAKQMLLDRLAARGIPAAALGAAAVTGGSAAAAVPWKLAAATVGLAVSGGTVPGAILSLAEGVTAMAITRTKLLAAAVLLAGGLAAGVGGGWLASAGAQDQPKKPGNNPPAATKGADQQADVLREVNELLASIQTKPAAKWEYEFLPLDKAMGFQELAAMFRAKESDGWEFVGSVPAKTVITGATDRNPPVPAGGGARNFGDPALVFRRPAKGATASADSLFERLALTRRAETARAAQSEAEARQQVEKSRAARAERMKTMTRDEAIRQLAVLDGAAELVMEENKRLRDELARQKGGGEAKGAAVAEPRGQPGVSAEVAHIRLVLVTTMRANPGARFESTLNAFLNLNDPKYRAAVERYGRDRLRAEVSEAIANLPTPGGPAAKPAAASGADRVNQLGEQIKNLQQELKKELDQLKAKSVTVKLTKADYGLTPHEMVQVIAIPANARFGAVWLERLKLHVDEITLTMSGDAEMVEWARGVLAAVSRKPAK